MPYDNYFDGEVPDCLWFEKLLQDAGGGLNEPAAVIVETVHAPMSTARLARRRITRTDATSDHGHDSTG